MLAHSRKDMTKRNETGSASLRHVPSVDQLLRTDAARRLRETREKT